MCGRFALTTAGKRLAEHFGYEALVAAGDRYNIAPSEPIWTLASEAAGAPAVRVLGWGLVPMWAKDPQIGQRMINARAETVAEKPAYRRPYRSRRCLVLADGYYEWRQTGNGRKQPYFIQREDKAPFAFAGLWDHWRNPADPEDQRETATILTTEATPTLAHIHHRMPVIADDTLGRAWLADIGDRSLAALLDARATLPLVATPVSTRVNSPRNDDAGCIRPVPEPEDGPDDDEPSLF